MKSWEEQLYDNPRNHYNVSRMEVTSDCCWFINPKFGDRLSHPRHHVVVAPHIRGDARVMPVFSSLWVLPSEAQPFGRRKILRLRSQLPVEPSQALSGVIEEHIAITTITISNSWHIHVQVRKVDVSNESIHTTSLTLPASCLFLHISATKSRYITT